MVKPIELLGKILTLEVRDYHYHDKAVSGGLSRYADTWSTQARKAYGDQPWIAEVVNHLTAYSDKQPAARIIEMRALWEVLRAHVPSHEVLPATLPVEEEPPPKLPRQPASPSREPGRGVDAPVTMISRVGQKRAQLLSKVGVTTIRHLLHLYPRRYEDYSTMKTINQLQLGERVSVVASVWEAGGRRSRSNTYIFRAILSDRTGSFEVTWFNQPYLAQKIRAGMQLRVSGEVREYLGRLTMTAPEWEPVGKNDITSARIQPIYPLTEGLTQRWMRKTIERALISWATRIPDPLPETLRIEHELLPLERALWGIHLPDNNEHLQAAQRRLAFEEVLYLQVGLLQRKQAWQSQPGKPITITAKRLAALKAALPYTLTDAQHQALNEMLADMATGQPMNRLLQGDVGAGKTVVAALLMMAAIDAGYQAALMAPTEILAEQHYASLQKLFAAFPDPSPKLALLTGSTSRYERPAIYNQLAKGSLQAIVGTHALIQPNVTFDRLALAIVDEQHRFGVEQRQSLRQKGFNPHLMLMTATPIPRSLELTVWGHLDVAVLDEMPPGRQPIKTRVLFSREQERAYNFIRTQVQQGRQAFIIYPLVEESENIDAPAAVQAYQHLQTQVLPDLRLGLLHGRMSPDEKDEVMKHFVKGNINVLVATSVVEVGIDVPNASVILIEGAERFGLSQLHQFRGRVGRGAHQSYCLLLPNNPSQEANKRLKALEDTTDGFILAQKDLEMRGPGEFLGQQQSGFPDLPLVGMADTRLLHQVRHTAIQILEQDPTLSAPEHQIIAQNVADLWDQQHTD